jgi:D-amino-acid dehydrogenase
VLAGGAWSARLARQLGPAIPLETQRGYHVTVESNNLRLTHTVMAVEHNLMVNPMRMGLRLAGTVEFAGLSAPPDMRRADALLARGREMFPHLDTSRVTRWMGHRPCLPDSMPVIGRAPRADNAWFAFGHGHVGMCGAASTGREVANLVAGREPQIDLAPFAPTRFRAAA